ncbi:unnamed protein product, partial [Staurois parvus]
MEVLSGGQRGMKDTEWMPVEGLSERGGRYEGWRILSGGQWRDWQRGVADTERSANEEGVTIVKARYNQGG